MKLGTTEDSYSQGLLPSLLSPPPTKYAKSGEVHIAYQVFGQGSFDLVMVPGWTSHIEYAWEDPVFANFLNRLGSFCRVTWFDKRGTGLSDREVGMPTLEQRMDDVRAVMDAAAVRQASVFGVSEGGSMSALFAATYPERVSSLILYGAFARRIWSPDYPWAPMQKGGTVEQNKTEYSGEGMSESGAKARLTGLDRIPMFDRGAEQC